MVNFHLKFKIIHKSRQLTGVSSFLCYEGPGNRTQVNRIGSRQPAPGLALAVLAHPKSAGWLSYFCSQKCWALDLPVIFLGGGQSAPAMKTKRPLPSTVILWPLGMEDEGDAAAHEDWRRCQERAAGRGTEAQEPRRERQKGNVSFEGFRGMFKRSLDFQSKYLHDKLFKNYIFCKTKC